MSSDRSPSTRGLTTVGSPRALLARRVGPATAALRRTPAASTPPVPAGRPGDAGMPPERARLVALLPRLDPIRFAVEPRELHGVIAMPRTRTGELGPTSSCGGRSLLCDLASPIAVGSEPRYVLQPPGAERSSNDMRFQRSSNDMRFQRSSNDMRFQRSSNDILHAYRWTVRRRDDGRPVWQTVSSGPEVRIAAAAPGRYVIEVAVLADGSPTGVRLGLDQDVELEPEALTAGLRGASPAAAQAMRELVTELRPYILDAAAATGPGGITARLLAAALFIEILSRPKAERERELDGLGRRLAALDRGELELFPSAGLDRPLGVGQIRPMTAAMVLGAAPWIEQDDGERRPVRERIQAGYDALPVETKRTIFTQLRWPRSNIALAARLLDMLKNRPHRYQGLPRAQLAADPRAVGIIATEYVGGATRTPAADARSSGYGYWVWHQMQDPLVQRFFPDDGPP